MDLYLCDYHNRDLDLHGYVNTHPQITCKACRAHGFFSPAAVRRYEARYFKRVAIYTRRIGYPDTLLVILDEEMEDFARRIAPKSDFTFKEIRILDTNVVYSYNAKTLPKPLEAATLEDSRREWDKAPWYVRS